MITKPPLDNLAERFCATPLPEGVRADPCACNSHHPNRSGTNLLTVREAKEMLGAVLAPIARVEKHTGQFKDMAVIVWTGEQPPEGTVLYMERK